MYGKYKIPFEYSDDNITLSITEDGDFFRYVRQIKDKEKKEKTLLTTENATISINPIEPINLPKQITQYLEIEFTPVLIEPEGFKVIFLLFPIEIGVIVSGNKKMEAIDIFSFGPQKYSLYGPSAGGVITKCYCSDIYSSPPESDKFYSGILRLEIGHMVEDPVAGPEPEVQAHRVRQGSHRLDGRLALRDTKIVVLGSFRGSTGATRSLIRRPTAGSTRLSRFRSERSAIKGCLRIGRPSSGNSTGEPRSAASRYGSEIACTTSIPKSSTTARLAATSARWSR